MFIHLCLRSFHGFFEDPLLSILSVCFLFIFFSIHMMLDFLLVIIYLYFMLYSYVFLFVSFFWLLFDLFELLVFTLFWTLLFVIDSFSFCVLNVVIFWICCFLLVYFFRCCFHCCLDFTFVLNLLGYALVAFFLVVFCVLFNTLSFSVFLQNSFLFWKVCHVFRRSPSRSSSGLWKMFVLMNQ